MKWIPAFRVIAVALCFGAVGRPVDAAEKADAESVESATVKNLRLIITIEGKQTEATNEIRFPKDIVLGTNGVFKVAGGKERPLAEGQILSREGTLTNPDGSIVPVEDHLTARRGTILLVRDGEPQPLNSALTLKNGSRVHPDGRIVTPRNQVTRLLDGQIVKLSDSAVESTDTARLEKGRVILFKDGGKFEIKPGQVMMMSDGSRVNSGGVVIKRDGSRINLKEGELYKFAGAGDRRP